MNALMDRLSIPLNEYLDDPAVTDICANKPKQLFVRKEGKWNKIAVPFYDENRMDALTILIANSVGKEFDEAHPYVNGTLKGGQRFQGVRPHGTPKGKFLWAIRRPPATARELGDDDMAGMTAETNRTPTRQQKGSKKVIEAFKARDFTQCLREARLAGFNIGFCGPTGGGKTDMQRRCIQVYRPGVRIVTVESDDEYGAAGPENKAQLLFDDTVVPADEAVRIAKRLIPNEIFFQEVRGAEAYPLVQALESGHTGCTSWHARPGKEIESLGLMVRQHASGRDMSEERLAMMLTQAFDILVYCEREDDENAPSPFRITNIRLMAAELEAVS